MPNLKVLAVRYVLIFLRILLSNPEFENYFSRFVCERMHLPVHLAADLPCGKCLKVVHRHSENCEHDLLLPERV